MMPGNFFLLFYVGYFLNIIISAGITGCDTCTHRRPPPRGVLGNDTPNMLTPGTQLTIEATTHRPQRFTPIVN